MSHPIVPLAPRSAGDLASALGGILGDRCLASEMGVRADASTREMYVWPTVAERAQVAEEARLLEPPPP